jgi:septal ring factor EnvC (AmiA/AmiB activator)
MHKFEPFIDLRQNNRELTTDSSMWPTFTDIMTVVLMIFMFTMIAMIIKNSNLLQKLNITEGQLELTEKTQQKLQTQIVDLEQKLKDKKMELILLSDEKTMLQKNLDAKLAIISQLQKQSGTLDETVKILTQEAHAKEEVLKKTKEAYDSQIAAITEDSRKQIEEFNQKFAELMQALQKKEEEISTITEGQQELELALAKQRQEYSVLEDKYNKLIGPARSPLGKEVVTVMYSKAGSEYRILLQDLNTSSFKLISEKYLHERLSQLKGQYKDKLYIKVIFPEKSNLSYNEAWNFTREVLKKYDYYYQSNP